MQAKFISSAAVAASICVVAFADGIYHDGWIDFNKNGRKDVYEDRSQSVERRVADLLSKMNLDEKSCQTATLYGYGRVLKDPLPTERWKHEVWKDGIANIDEQLNGVGRGYKTSLDLIYPFSNHVEAINRIQRWFVEETRLGIPVDFSNEGIHGLNHTKATPLPAPIATGSTWNKALVRRAGEIVGREAKLLGYSNVYAPILDVVRDPRWGRTLECYGESPFLIAELGVRMSAGIQSQGVGSTLKHYAAYSVPKGGRDGNCRTDPHIAPRELHEIFLYPFRRVVEEARPMGVMCSYNDWDGVPVAASRYFLTDLLRGQYGFDGYVVSDSEAVEFVHAKHAVAPTYDDAVRQVLEAGLNVRTHFTKPKDFIIPVRRLVNEGRLSERVLDKRVSEVLSVKFRLGLFDSPYVSDPAAADRLAGADKHLDFVDALQDESLVLLKNDAGLLPLDASKTRKILVAGPLADETNFMTSRYGPNGLESVSVLRGIRERLAGRVEVVYRKGCSTVDKNWPDSEIVPVPLTAAESSAMDDAVAAAADVDVIVAVLGEDEKTCGESRSRTSLDLPGRQQLLLERLHATGRPVVLVLVNGQPLTLNWADRNIPAILETWFPCCRGGISIAKALFGDINPSGRLTVTFPRSIGQIELNFPFKKGSHGTQHGSGPNGSGKTRVQGVLYPFGHGLGYTTFEYSGLEVTPRRGGAKGPWRVSCRVKNTGRRSGSEVVQLYLHDEFSSTTTYESVLRGFEKVRLESGEERRVEFTLTPEHLKMLGRDMEWGVEPGMFEVRVGASSADIRLRDRFEVVDDTIKNVRDFGAVGDGVTDDTDAVQAAIDKGGEVYLPPGIYSCGTLHLRSNGGLRLSDGATIRAIPDRTRYNRPDFCPQNGSGENKLAAHLIVAVGCTNVFVRGGTIDGNSTHFHKGMKIHYRSMRGRPTKTWPKWLPAQMMFFCECDGVVVEDSHLVNSTFWSCFFHGCDNVVVRRLVVLTDPKIAGDDGIDVDSCSNVLVEDCTVDTGDDAIAIRGSPSLLTDKMKPCEHVRVRNCRVRSEYANGVRVGVGGGIIRDVRISDIVMENTRGALHINPRYSDNGRGVDISDVTFENIKATCDNFIFLCPDFFFVKTNQFDRAIKDIRFSNLSGTCRLPLVIRGNGKADVHDILVERSRFTFLPSAGMPSGDWEYFLLDGPGGTLVTNDTRNVVLRDVVLEDLRDASSPRKEVLR